MPTTPLSPSLPDEQEIARVEGALAQEIENFIASYKMTGNYPCRATRLVEKLVDELHSSSIREMNVGIELAQVQGELRGTLLACSLLFPEEVTPEWRAKMQKLYDEKTPA